MRIWNTSPVLNRVLRPSYTYWTWGLVRVHALLMHRHCETKTVCSPACELAPMWDITLTPCGMMWLWNYMWTAPCLQSICSLCIGGGVSGRMLNCVPMFVHVIKYAFSLILPVFFSACKPPRGTCALVRARVCMSCERGWDGFCVCRKWKYKPKDKLVSLGPKMWILIDTQSKY